jgi:hypothetical protein
MTNPPRTPNIDAMIAPPVRRRTRKVLTTEERNAITTRLKQLGLQQHQIDAHLSRRATNPPPGEEPRPTIADITTIRMKKRKAGLSVWNRRDVEHGE